MDRIEGAVTAVRAALLGTRLRIAATVVGLLGVTIVGAFAFGVLGAPAVQDVDNRFGNVSNDTTVIKSDLQVHNPNPIGIQLGDTTIRYLVRMNGVPVAEGGREGLDVETGTSTLPFTTRMDNGQIPAWWVTHVNNDERTVITINATVRTSVVGRHRFDLTQEKVIETDIIGNFNTDETRPVRSDDPPPVFSDPLLYVNRTGAEWGEATEEATPIDMEFVLYNPQTLPFTVAELGYEITMNGVRVGEGTTDELTAIPSGQKETVTTRARIINPNLDDWWVTHLRNDQVTQLRIEFYAVLTGEDLTRDVRVPLDRLTYEETIETDMFGNKNQSNGTTPSATPTGDGTPTPTPTPTPTELPDPVTTPTDTELV